MKSFIATLVLLASMSPVMAQKIQAPLPFGTGGTAAPAMIVIVDELKNKGWDVDFNVLRTCGPVKQIFESETEPVLTFWNDLWNDNKENTCYLDLKQENFVDVVRTTWKYLCGPKGESDYQLESGKTYRLGTTGYGIDITKNLLNNLADRLGVTFRYIPYESSGRLRTAYEAGEFDLIYNFSGRKYHNEDNTKCFYNNSQETIDGIPSIFTEIDLILPLDVYNLFIVVNGRGLTDEQQDKLKSDLRNIVENNEILNDNLKRTYADRYKGTPEEQFRFVTRQ